MNTEQIGDSQSEASSLPIGPVYGSELDTSKPCALESTLDEALEAVMHNINNENISDAFPNLILFWPDAYDDVQRALISSYSLVGVMSGIATGVSNFLAKSPESIQVGIASTGTFLAAAGVVAATPYIDNSTFGRWHEQRQAPRVQKDNRIKFLKQNTKDIKRNLREGGSDSNLETKLVRNRQELEQLQPRLAAIKRVTKSIGSKALSGWRLFQTRMDD